MKKWQIKNLEKSEILEISQKLFQVSFFQVFDFALQPKSKTPIKKSWKKISEISEILTWSHYDIVFLAEIPDSIIPLTSSGGLWSRLFVP